MSRPILLGSLTTRITLPTCTSVPSTFNEYAVTLQADNLISSCYPPNYSIDGVYSPGVCPIGWYSACRFTSGGLYVKTAISAYETGVQCCPNYFTCRGDVAYCTSNSVYGKPILVLYRATDSAIAQFFAGGAFSVPTTTQLSTVLMTTTASPSLSISTVTAIASTVTATPSMVTVTPSTTSVYSSPSTGSNSASTASIDNTSASGGLSTGAKIGLGVGIPLFVIIVAAICVIFFLIRRKRKQDRDDVHAPDEFPAMIHVGNHKGTQSPYATSQSTYTAVPSPYAAQTSYSGSATPYSRTEVPEQSTPMLAYSSVQHVNGQPARWSD